MGRCVGGRRDLHRGHVQRESLAEIPDQVTVQVHGPVATVIISVEPHLTAIDAASPFLQVAIIPAAADGLIAGGLGVRGVLVVLGIILYIGMDTIFLVAKDIVAIGNALQQVDRLLAVVPG